MSLFFQDTFSFPPVLLIIFLSFSLLILYHLELAPSQQVVEIFYILLTIDLTKKARSCAVLSIFLLKKFNAVL